MHVGARVEVLTNTSTRPAAVCSDPSRAGFRARGVRAGSLAVCAPRPVCVTRSAPMVNMHARVHARNARAAHGDDALPGPFGASVPSTLRASSTWLYASCAERDAVRTCGLADAATWQGRPGDRAGAHASSSVSAQWAAASQRRRWRTAHTQMACIMHCMAPLSRCQGATAGMSPRCPLRARPRRRRRWLLPEREYAQTTAARA